MPSVKTRLISVKNHITSNRGKYSAAATAIVCVAVQMRAAKELNEFLEEKGLSDEYYNPEAANEN